MSAKGLSFAVILISSGCWIAYVINQMRLVSNRHKISFWSVSSIASSPIGYPSTLVSEFEKHPSLKDDVDRLYRIGWVYVICFNAAFLSWIAFFVVLARTLKQ